MNKDIKEEKGRVNPFFLPYDTPHDTVPFDRIELADYEEAMMEGIRRENETDLRKSSIILMNQPLKIPLSRG